MGFREPSLASGGTITGDVIVTGDLTVQGNFNFGDASTDVLTVNGQLHAPNDVVFSFGNTDIAPDSSLRFFTGYGGGNALFWELPTASVDNLAWLILGTETARNFNTAFAAGDTAARLVFLDPTATFAGSLSHNGSQVKLEALTSPGLAHGVSIESYSDSPNTFSDANIFVSPAQNSHVEIQGVIRDNPGTFFASLQITSTENLTADGSRNTYGIYGKGQYGDGSNNLGYIVGVHGESYHAGAGNVGTMIGVQSHVYQDTGAVTVNSAIGFDAQLTKSGGDSTITEYIAFNSSAFSGDGLFTARQFLGASDLFITTRGLKVKAGSLGSQYLPISNIPNGLGFDSSDLNLSTTTSGFIQIYSASTLSMLSTSGNILIESTVTGNVNIVGATGVEIDSSNGTLELTAANNNIILATTLGGNIQFAPADGSNVYSVATKTDPSGNFYGHSFDTYITATANNAATNKGFMSSLTHEGGDFDMTGDQYSNVSFYYNYSSVGTVSKAVNYRAEMWNYGAGTGDITSAVAFQGYVDEQSGEITNYTLLEGLASPGGQVVRYDVLNLAPEYTSNIMTLKSTINSSLGYIPYSDADTGITWDSQDLTFATTSSGRIILSPTGNLELTPLAHTTTTRRFQEAQGADVASANDLTLGGDGNSFEITGAVQVNAILATGWQNGSKVTLLFTSNPVVKHNTAGGAGTAVMLLAGAADFAATAGDNITFLLSEIGGTQAWREISRTTI